MTLKKIREPFFSQNQRFRKAKCLFILFLSKSKMLLRLNHRIPENWQNCNKKIRNFQFW